MCCLVETCKELFIIFFKGCSPLTEKPLRMNKSNLSTPEGESKSQLEGFTGAELAIANTLIGFGLKHGPAVGEAMIKAWKGDQPIFFQINASWKDGLFYYMIISFSNLTEHGIYIEELIIKDPLQLPVYVRTSQEKDLMSRDIKWVEAKDLFPVLLATGDSSTHKFTIRISNFPEPDSTEPTVNLSKYDIIRLKYTYSQLDKKESESREKDIRIRSKGPSAKS